MGRWIHWSTWIVLTGLLVLLVANSWTAVHTYQSMTETEIVAAQAKEQAQRQLAEQQVREGAGEGERPHKRGFFEDTPFRQVEMALREAGSQSVPLLWIAFSFWLVIELIKRFAKRFSESVRTFVRKLAGYLREQHRAIGWLSFGFAAVHSFYYLALWWFKSMQFEALLLWSGMVSMGAFLLLALWGEWLQWHERDKGARKVHWAMSFLMIGGLVVHDVGSLGKIVLVFGAFVLLYLISQGINRLNSNKLPVASE